AAHAPPHPPEVQAGPVARHARHLRDRRPHCRRWTRRRRARRGRGRANRRDGNLMATTGIITDVDVFTEPVPHIVDGDALNGENFRAEMQAVANRTRWLKNRMTSTEDFTSS